MNAPFQYGTLATKENFVDRVEDRAQLKGFLASHINVMLISPRRWGKSSLVKVAMEELQNEEKDIRVCFIDAFSIGSEAEFYRTFASQVIACASTKLERRIQDAKKFLTGVVPQVVIKDDVTNFMAFDVKFVPQEQDNSPMFLSDTELLAPSQLEMLRAIKDGVQQLSSTEAKSAYALGNPNTISKNKKVLRDKDIIEDRKGKLSFVDPVYHLWFSHEY